MTPFYKPAMLSY